MHAYRKRFRRRRLILFCLSLTTASGRGRKTKKAAQMDDEALKRVALSFLSWDGYQADEKERLAEILVQYARGALPWPYGNDVHAAIGHYMKCGQRYMQIYAAERWGIESFLLAANAA